MRVYLPATVPLLRRALADGEFRPVGGTGFAVTAALRDEFDGDEQELEYLAMRDAARASLRLIAGSGAEPVRVVLAADQDAGVVERGDLDRAAVQLPGGVGWAAVAAVHLDGGDVADAVTAAAAAVDDADLGDPDAEFTVGGVEDIDLAWYAPDEIRFLFEESGTR